MKIDVFQGLFIKLKAFKGFTDSEHTDKNLTPHLWRELQRRGRTGPQPLLLAGMGKSEFISLVWYQAMLPPSAWTSHLCTHRVWANSNPLPSTLLVNNHCQLPSTTEASPWK